MFLTLIRALRKLVKLVDVWTCTHNNYKQKIELYTRVLSVHINDSTTDRKHIANYDFFIFTHVS